MTTIADWIIALGTLALVIVAIFALFQDKIRALMIRPKLTVSVNINPPDCHKTKFNFNKEIVTSFETEEKMIVQDSADVYYFRLRVSNSGNEKAASAEVFAAGLSKQQADGTYKAVDSFLPMNLVWSNIRTLFFPVISPGTYKHCDLAHVIDPKKRSLIPVEETEWSNIPSERTILSFDTFVKPNILSHLVPYGKYHLTIIVAAENANPITKVLEIMLTGDWYDEEDKMLGEGISVRII